MSDDAIKAKARRIEWLVWAGLLLLIATLLLAFLLAQLRVREYLGKPLQVYGTIADFALTNQSGTAVSLADLRGHVWVADIIFTRCPGPCRSMTRQMRELQQALPPGARTKLVSLTTDPDFDTPAVLTNYARDAGTDTNRWLFLTGTKAEIANLAVSSLKLVAMEKKPDTRESPQDLFIHSTIFVVVDKQAQLRGVFETTGEGIDPRKVKDQVIAAVRRLERER